MYEDIGDAGRDDGGMEKTSTAVDADHERAKIKSDELTVRLF